MPNLATFNVSAICTAGFIVLVAPAQAASDCRTAALPDGTPALFCKDAAGKWQQQAGAVVNSPSAGAAPSAVSARGTATYRGTYSAYVGPKQRTNTSLNLENMFKQAMNAGANSTKYEGAIDLVMTFDGAAVTAKFSGTGGIRSGTMTGLVRDGKCRLTDSDNTEVYEGPCTRTRFHGTITGTANNRKQLSGTFDTQSSDFVDLGIRDARRAELKAKCDAGREAACVEMDQLK